MINFTAMQKIIVTCLLFLLLNACSKSNNGKDNEAPVITFTSPANNQVFSGGQAVPISASLSDNKRVAEVHVHVSNNATGTLLMDVHRYPNAASYALNETFTVQAGIQYKIQLLVKDNSANENNATVLISGN